MVPAVRLEIEVPGDSLTPPCTVLVSDALGVVGQQLDDSRSDSVLELVSVMVRPLAITATSPRPR